MDQLEQEQQEKLKKMSTDRIRAKLIDAGYREAIVYAADRQGLVELMAEHMLQPGAAVGSVLEQPDLGELKAEDWWQQDEAVGGVPEQPNLGEFRVEGLRQQEVTVGNPWETVDPADLRRKELQLKERELRLREQELQEQKAARCADFEWRREEAKRLRVRDEQIAERDKSLPTLTKKYGDIMKHVLPRMPTDPGELMTFWDTCENLWEVYEVPENLRAKLLLPLLSPKAKTLVSRLSVVELADVKKIKEFLLQEFKLTSREYRARFNAATRTSDETHTLFMNRLKNLWTFYMRSRECDSFDKLVDLVVADRLKESLSGPCLKYCLAIEGKKTLSASELASLADVYDVNYTPDGRYRGGTVTSFREANGVNTQHGVHRQVPPSRPAPPEVSKGVANTVSRLGSNSGQGQQSAQTLRKCWTCGSTSHMRSACPRGGRLGSGTGRFQSQSARVDACVVKDAQDVTSTPGTEGDTMKVHVNHCVVETPQSCSDEGVCDILHCVAPVVLRVDKADATEVADSVDFDKVNSCNASGVATAQIHDRVTVVQTSPLTYVPVMIENSGPYKCLSDSGTEFSVAKHSVVEGINPNPPIVGQIKLQGIFGEPIMADLVTLNLTLCASDTGQGSGRPVPVTVAVTQAMVQDCDLIVPAEIVKILQCNSADDKKSMTALANVTTRSHTLASERSQTCSEKELGSDESVSTYKAVDQQSDDFGPRVKETQNSHVTNDMVINNTDDPRLVFSHKDDRVSLIQEQKTDATLDPCWRLAKHGKGGMVVEDGILYHWDEVCGHKVKQLCVPYARRMQVMRMAHDADTSGHFAGRKTRDRIRLNFYWPSLKRDVCSYTSSCVPCQLRARARRDDHVPITPIVRPSVPFVVCHADIIGPIDPPSAQGHKWALCIIDDCTRWPAVYLLKSLTAKATCQAFMELFSLTGWPEIICTDQGSNFCSQMTQEFLKRMGVSPRIHSPYHPEASGVIERFNCSFKNMLNHAIHDYGRQWHKVVPCLVWSLREIPNRTTSVSPHFLLFGRVPRGPMAVLRETWTGYRDSQGDDSKPVDQYIQDLETNMRSAREYARIHADTAQQQYAKQYNKHAKEKAFQVGEQVVVLEKDSAHKVFARWKQGTVTRVRSPHSYEVQMSDGSRRWLHANKLRPFVARVQNVGVIRRDDVDFGKIRCMPKSETENIQLPSNYIDSSALNHLNDDQQEAVLSVLDEFADVFSETPGLCTVVEHEINVTPDFRPRMSRAYRVPEVLKKEIERQVAELLELGFIVPSRSPMASGVVCVLKPDKSVRMACDYRYLNSYTIDDGFPMPNLTDVMHRVGSGRFITVCDAKSGYWQLYVKPEHRWLTAFVTHHGLWEWVRMPFGLKAAGNTFVRAVQILLQPIRDFSDSYVDDLSAFSGAFEVHLEHLRKFFGVIRESGLKLNFRKCSFARSEVKYLGHLIGCGRHRPDPERTKAVTELKPPTTKKQLRQVLGLFSYYRTYVPDFAAIAKPLTDLTGSRQPSALIWDSAQQLAFEMLRAKISEAPVLQVPTPGQPFVLYTDANANTVACQLAQHDAVGAEHPVAFASLKLTTSQCAWSVVEREAFAIVWALHRFRNVIFGAHITVYTDHNPLRYLTESAPKSAKLTRWALALQEYDLSIKYYRGSDNVVADSLSRLS